MNRTHIGKPILRWIHIPSTDPDDARRRKLLNILLAGLAILSILALIGTLIVDLSVAEQFGEIYVTALVVLVGVIVVWTINRYGSGWLASVVFLLLLTVVLTVADTPEEVAGGRSTFAFVIPILMASFLLRPWGSFAMAGLSSLILSAIALSLQALPNVPSMTGLFAIALVSWLAARSLQQALRDLRESETRYRAIVEDQSELICRFLPEGAMTFANEAFCRYFGVAHYGALAGRSVQVLAAEVSAGDPRCEEFLASLCSLEPIQTFECPMIVRGEKRWLQWTAHPVHDDQNQVTEYQCVGRDVTTQVLVEHKLAQSEERFRRMAESIQDGLTIVEQGRVVYLNDRVCEITGRSSEELYTMSSLEFAAPEERERLRQAMEAARQSGTLPANLAFWIVRPDGTRRCIHNRYTVKHWEGGLVDRYVVTTDVTEQRRMEEHLRQAQKMEAMGRLAAGVAHDFNNYLTVIDSYADLLQMDLEPDAPIQHELAEIARAVERSKSLVRQLLAFSRQQMLHPQVLNVNEVIARAEDILRRLAGRDIELDTECDPDLGLVRADPGQIEQILLNLVTNARDAIAGMGRIAIRTANVESDHTDEKEDQLVHYVMIAVSDTGAGIDREAQAHIFEPFFTTKENGSGTGLGLSTVYGIVRQSGGNIEVKSEPGQGTTFTIYLPRIDDSKEALI